MLEFFEPAAIDLLLTFPSFSLISLDSQLSQMPCYHSLAMDSRSMSNSGDSELQQENKHIQNFLFKQNVNKGV